MTRLEGAYSAIEIGKKKAAEGDLRRAHMAYEAAINDFMYLSFWESDNVTDIKHWLSGHPLEITTKSFIRIVEKIIVKPKTEWTTYFQSGNYLLISFSNFFAMLDHHDRSAYFSRIATEPILFSTHFWGEFGKMYGALIRGTTYAPQFGKLDFSEKYKVPYVELMSAVMRGEPLDASIAEIDRQFVARNRDDRMNNADPYMIEGSPEHPVKFDFRKAGLLATIANTKLRAIT